MYNYNFDPSLAILFDVGEVEYPNDLDKILTDEERWKAIHIHQTGQWGSISMGLPCFNSLANFFHSKIPLITNYRVRDDLEIMLVTELHESHTMVMFAGD